MLLLTDKDLGVWTCDGMGPARRLFEPGAVNNLGRSIKPVDAIMSKYGYLIMIHDQDGASTIFEMSMQDTLIAVVYEVTPSIVSTDRKLDGHLVAILCDSSAVH